MGPKILTVDDSKTIRLIIGKAFKSFDCEVFEASNGVEGLAVAAKEKPDIIILDLTMPIMDGYETLTKLKSDPELKGIPVVMLTAEAGRENVLRIAKQGVRDYLVKPFKEEVIIDRVGRIIDLKPKGVNAARIRRFDDSLTILVVDDKPAIAEMIRSGLKTETNWTVISRAQTGEAVDYCTQTVPDLVLISLSLGDGAGFSLFQLLRATTKTKTVPVFGLCVKTAIEEQGKAQQIGFTGIITKPIDLEDIKAKVTRSLNLDTSYKYFQNKNDVLVLSLPSNFTSGMANEVSAHLRVKISEAVDSGIDKAVFDVSQLKNADINLIKLGLDVMQLCNELSLRNRVIGSELISRECRNFEETKDWRFVNSFDEAIQAFNGKEIVQAA
ncbi:MAG: histidine kinase [Verrucomicrobiales bacterium]|nr:histidine kinase [Verrucomicrobiales bacterium]MDB6131141.1 histidine kinase [Verrucomicrobiales bacterium]